MLAQEQSGVRHILHPPVIVGATPSAPVEESLFIMLLRRLF